MHRNLAEACQLVNYVSHSLSTTERPLQAILARFASPDLSTLRANACSIGASDITR